VKNIRLRSLVHGLSHRSGEVKVLRNALRCANRSHRRGDRQSVEAAHPGYLSAFRIKNLESFGEEDSESDADWDVSQSRNYKIELSSSEECEQFCYEDAS